MAMELMPGTRLRSDVCATEVIVVKAPTAPVDLDCGGTPMIAVAEGPAGGAIDPVWASGTQLGKRYALDDVGVEVLCTKAGDGSLSVGGASLQEKQAKPLPSSD